MATEKSLLPPGATIRRARRDDIEGWVEALTSSRIATYDFGAEFVAARRAAVEPNRLEMLSLLDDPDRAFWLAEDPSGILGVAETGLGPLSWESDEGAPPPLVPLQLITLYLLPRAQGQGIGRALLDQAIGNAAAYLWVFSANTRAVEFYRRLGFVTDGAEVHSGPEWGDTVVQRMYRPAGSDGYPEA